MHDPRHVFFEQFMRPRSRDKKLHEEWAVPLKSVEDIYEVKFPSEMHSFLPNQIITTTNVNIFPMELLLIRNLRITALGN